MRCCPRTASASRLASGKATSAQGFLRGAKPRKLYLIDPWQHSSHSGAWYAEKDEEEMADIREEVVARFARQIQRERVVVIANQSQDAVRQLTSAHRSDLFDWAYLDGDHTYEAVLAYLRAFWTLIRDGGCLAGDDYGIKGWWNDGVTQAVDQFVASVDRSPVILGSQFLIRK
ncbi:MAG: class I SAM-dependent methyltransferase [Actinobacteria bacterium]|nr:MAG: class I SAM-dependent methyltransferase [Actinomycetota bacterium]